MKDLYYKITNKNILEKLDDIEVTERAINQYKVCVKGNNQEAEDMLVKKLKRNFICGNMIKATNTVEYGNLRINYKYYKDTNTYEIMSIYNFKGTPIKLVIDKKLKDKIDKLIELNLF